ncbi:hypothetical protein BDZ94DRAFT_1326691 [Collybia nuda]|uniref:Uncharacterized protein n=1 Tax=Collybia nuda TaxID=64659 RepID=A0A9P5XWI9_9AGAR|nr:hypothetical protein BDZ94DRAFT_1326691 [Collybia nuda]
MSIYHSRRITQSEILTTFGTLLDIAENDDVVESPYYLPYGYLFWCFAKLASSQQVQIKTSPQWQFRKYNPRLHRFNIEEAITSSPRATRSRVKSGIASLVEPMTELGHDIDMEEANTSLEILPKRPTKLQHTSRYPDFSCFSWKDGNRFRPFLIVEIKPPAYSSNTPYLIQTDEDAYIFNESLIGRTNSQVQDQARHVFATSTHDDFSTLYALTIAGRAYSFTTFQRKIPSSEEEAIISDSKGPSGNIIGTSTTGGDLKLDPDFVKGMEMAFNSENITE